MRIPASFRFRARRVASYSVVFITAVALAHVGHDRLLGQTPGPTAPNTNQTFGASAAKSAAEVPYPVASHPRLWITSSDIPRLRRWAVGSNPIYQQGLVPALNNAIKIYDTNFFPNGRPNPVYPDPGDTQGYQGNLTEQSGLILALGSLVAPDASARILYAERARNLLMYAMNQAALGHQKGAIPRPGFCDL